MSDRMRVLPFPALLDWILTELEEAQSVFGIPRSLFYSPAKDSAFALQDMFGQYLATPIGPAAGPHTQLAQNIVCAWLSGGRFIELKTVQIMDELEIARPCIDAADEGYNVEWSQELKLDQSAREYVKAWALIHILHRVLCFEEEVPPGTVFNVSVGYNLEGIQSAPMTRFLDQMADASELIGELRETIEAQYPQFADLKIPPRLANSVTLSTMHGCPPDEIERIAHYLLKDRGLHTTVKLNPTLLGKEQVVHILHDVLGFGEVDIPDSVFEKDLQYERAIRLITSLQKAAAERALTFGVKLSNTLATANHRKVLPGEDVYMSGRALFPITVNLFLRLAQDLHGELNVSYSAGADAVNVTDILAAGACPVTTATELLKPGGYSRLRQFLENLEQGMRERGAANLEELAQDKLMNLARLASEALSDPRYRKDYGPRQLPKVESGLQAFDCVQAPCVARCPACQDAAAYAWLIERRDIDGALQVVLSRNPLPSVTGYICTHVCQSYCTRSNYDEPVAIRALKRFAAERGRVTNPSIEVTDRRVAVIGSGPSGLAAAFYLALSGVQVIVLEARDAPGGMLRLAPAFRLPEAVLAQDLARISALGVEIKLNHPVTSPPESLLQQGYDAVYVATGFQKDARLNMEGLDAPGVFSALDLLERVTRDEEVELGARVLVVGGGNTAVDAARTVRRLTGKPVAVVYRRTRREMPATDEEKEALFAEGNRLVELASPKRVVLRAGRVAGLECVRNRLGRVGADGRQEPVPVPGSEFQIPADSIVLAVGQRADIAFLEGSSVPVRDDGTVRVDEQSGQAGPLPVYAGGDAVHGPATVIQACADGRRAAEAMCGRLGVKFVSWPAELPELSEADILKVKAVRAVKLAQKKPDMLPFEQERGFDLLEQTLSEEAARLEAARCVECTAFCDKCVEVCPNRANYAYSVTPLTARVPRLSCQQGGLMVAGEDTVRIEQGRQIIHIDDLCNECGNCATFCVHDGKPYLDKPRVFLTERDFEAELDNAFHIVHDRRGRTIRFRESGRESQLTLVANVGDIAFENEWFSLTLSSFDFGLKKTGLKKEFAGEFSLVKVMEAYVILRGVTESLPFVPLRLAR